MIKSFNCSTGFKKTDMLLSVHALLYVSKVFLLSEFSYKELEVVLRDRIVRV